MASGPCLCGDPYCSSCGNPYQAEAEDAIEELILCFEELPFTPAQLRQLALDLPNIIKDYQERGIGVDYFDCIEEAEGEEITGSCCEETIGDNGD